MMPAALCPITTRLRLPAGDSLRGELRTDGLQADVVRSLSYCAVGVKDRGTTIRLARILGNVLAGNQLKFSLL